MANDTTPIEQRSQLFIRLYQSVFPQAARYVSRRGGSLDEAKDVFQDALIIYYEKQTGQYEILRNEKAYVMGIVKHLWIKNFQHNNRYVPMDEVSAIADVAIAEEEQLLANKILRYLETSGQKCMDLLRSFYYDKLNMSEIAQTFGFSGERSATVQKFKCLEKVRETVKSKSLSYEDFVE